LSALLSERGFEHPSGGRLAAQGRRASSESAAIVPSNRGRYLAEIAECVRAYHDSVEEQVRLARERQQLRAVMGLMADAGEQNQTLGRLMDERNEAMDPRARKLLDGWPDQKTQYSGEELLVKVRDREIRTALTHPTRFGTTLPQAALPLYYDAGQK